MSHNLEQHGDQTAFVSAREDAWHKLGTVLPSAFTAEEALTVGHLANWNVRKQPLFTHLDDGTSLRVPDRFSVVRDNPFVEGQVDVLGPCVSGLYQVVQNEEMTGMLDALVEQAEASYETAGSIDGGKRVFVTMKLPGHLKIGGVDQVDMYLAAMTSHDGSTATTLMVTPVRIVCQNTMNLAYQQRKSEFRIRHTTNASKRVVQQAREALDFTYDYLDGFQEEANQLINTTMTQMQFEEIVTKAFGAPEGAPSSTRTRAENRIDQMVQLFADSYTHEGVRDTAWAGLNALTEWSDHFSPVRGSADPEYSRAVRAVTDTNFKNKARQLILQNI